MLIISEDTNALNHSMVDITYHKQNANILFRINDDNILNTDLVVPELSTFLDKKNKEDILTISPTFARKNEEEKNLLNLQNQIAQQKTVINQLKKQLNFSKTNAEKYNKNLQKQTERLKQIQAENFNNTQKISSYNKEVQQLEQQLQTQKAQLETQSNQLKVSAPDRSTFDSELTPGLETTITDLTKKLKNQQTLSNNLTIRLTDIKKENEALASFKALFYVLFLITIIALVAAFIMWKKSKATASKSTSSTNNQNKTQLTVREEQLIKSEHFVALGYVATDITYAACLSLVDFQEQLQTAGETKNVKILNPIVTLLENFNLIAADQDDIEVQYFDVIDYMQKMMMLYAFEFEQSDIVYHYSGEQSLFVRSVPSYIALILLHIINNSLKHGFDNNGKGKITLKVEKTAKGSAKIIYSDDGKGMSKDVLAKIYEPFFTTQTARGYVGVGMSTCHDLIKNKLGGDIQIDSKEGKGTTVIMTLN